MNDSTFTNYENYFSITSPQVTDVIPLTQNMEFDYLNNVSCDMAPLSQAASVDKRSHQTNLFNFMPSTNEENPQKHDGQCLANRANSNIILNNVGSSNSVFGNIPFVQIHTTDVPPQRTSYGNVFRRNISKQDEIKSEPIKSENTESSKDRTNASPTPPRTINTSQSVNNMESKASGRSQPININNIEEKSCSILQVYKCSQCLFISLRDTERDDHVASQHNENGAKNERQLMNCPGCSNVFFNQKSLEIHLKLDHLMRDGDVTKLINVILETSMNTSENRCSTLEPTNITTVVATSKEPIRKSRIYLKNVDFLREPNRQPMEQTDNQLTGNNTSRFFEPTKGNPPKQKISIKSVDVLREPALLRRDYEIQTSNLNSFINFNTDLLNNGIDLANSPVKMNNTNTYDYTQNIGNSLSKANLNNDNNLANSNNGDKSRRPKIYVKSVESFNLMPIDCPRTTNNTRYLNDHNNSQVYNSNVGHIPYIFDSNSTGNPLSGNGNFNNNEKDMDAFQFISASNPNNNYALDNSSFLGTDQMENVNLISDSTTPTPPSTADMSSIMDKPLITTQEQRGTLHLRTVDELNLMNKTEVQHLIAPNLDNNHSAEILDKINSSGLNDMNLIGDALYEDDNFKFHDLDTQMVNNWPETYEDLDEDINCIMANAPNGNSTENSVYSANNNSQKMNHSNFDIDTQQVSLITIRDIEELTGTANHATVDNVTVQQDSVTEQIQVIHSAVPTEIGIINQENLMAEQAKLESLSATNLKRELVNTTPESNETLIMTKDTTITGNKEIGNKILTSSNKIPPLVPVTNATNDLSSTILRTTNVSPLPNCNIPLPPLVPVSSTVKLKDTTNKTNIKSTSPLEKGRIYVANNLMEPPKRPVAVSAISGTSVRGRPFGSNRTRITKLKQTIGSSAEDLFLKCSVKGCAFRFKKAGTVEYHRKCHDMTSDSPQSMLCPECKSTEFNNWNTLHTHLWRAHQIDMELYKCELCEFKTPIFSRLVNTHAKIHFDDRNYKCEECEKAFKNSKQLKNHRRWHRVQATHAGVSNISKAPSTVIHRCSDCGSTFSQQKTLREHCCKKGDSSLKCSVCEKLMSSKSSLRLHILTHSDGEKKYKCQNCDYATNDHNAFRRHRMSHENRKMYECNFCPYKSVQSVAYQKHIQQKHPDKVDSVIHKCTVCSYSTINRSLLIVHQVKHDKIEDLTKNKSSDEISCANTTEKSLDNNPTERKSKIKVKSNLFTTHINESLVNIKNNDLNLVQLYM